MARPLLNAPRMFRALVVLSVLAGCATSSESTYDESDFDSIDLPDGKSDRPGAPTEKGTLGLDHPVHDRLRIVTSGYHRYTFHADAGEWMRIYLDSPDFRPYMRITGPASETWSDTALDFYHPIDHVYWALVDFRAPEAGTYEVLATSVWNMRLFPVAKTSGAYVLTLMSERCDDDGVC